MKLNDLILMYTYDFGIKVLYILIIAVYYKAFQFQFHGMQIEWSSRISRRMKELSYISNNTLLNNSITFCSNVINENKIVMKLILIIYLSLLPYSQQGNVLF